MLFCVMANAMNRWLPIHSDRAISCFFHCRKFVFSIISYSDISSIRFLLLFLYAAYILIWQSCFSFLPSLFLFSSSLCFLLFKQPKPVELHRHVKEQITSSNEWDASEIFSHLSPGLGPSEVTFSPPFSFGTFSSETDFLTSGSEIDFSTFWVLSSFMTKLVSFSIGFLAPPYFWSHTCCAVLKMLLVNLQNHTSKVRLRDKVESWIPTKKHKTSCCSSPIET